ncbi:hypothetical protein [Streptomyces sp. NPDC060031]|uniref:hypothetical protein n=1 Tax=Streptomyces sp. NPDC060031 TaxID=3347043 RepID=UPI0036ADA04C
MPDGRTALVTHDGLTSRMVRDTVDEAVRYGAEHRAALVLAFLGHGFNPAAAARSTAPTFVPHHPPWMPPIRPGPA